MIIMNIIQIEMLIIIETLGNKGW